MENRNILLENLIFKARFLVLDENRGELQKAETSFEAFLAFTLKSVGFFVKIHGSRKAFRNKLFPSFDEMFE